MATKKFLIEVEEGRTKCGECPIAINMVNCLRYEFSHRGLDCEDYNLATIKIKEYEDKD